MTKAGLIFGSNILMDISEKAKERKVKTRYGVVNFYHHNDLLILPRHGIKHDVPPHKINHKAHMEAFAKEKVKLVIGVCSAGSLKKNIRPGSLVVPYDYINFSNVQTFFDNKIIHTLPEIDEALRKRILGKAKWIKLDVFEGIYAQTKGPRLETKAEISLLKQHADVVGMTMATEATLAKELGIKYAGICSVDNYANGIDEKELSFKDIQRAAKQNSEKIKTLLKALFSK